MEELLLVLNKDEDTLSFIDLKKGKVAKSVETDHNPHEIAVAPDKKHAFVTCSLGNAVNVIDIEAMAIAERITDEDFSFPHGVGVSQEGKLYIASTKSSMIHIFDAGNYELLRKFPTRQHLSHMVAFSPDEKRIYVPNIGSHNITVIDVEKEEILTHIPVGKGPEGIAVHPEGNELYVANQHDNSLYVLDTETYETLHKRRLGSVPVRLVFSQDGKYALVPNRESNDISIIDTKHLVKGEARPWEIKRLPVGVWPGGTVFNADGTIAYVANNKTNDISIIDMATLQEKGRIAAGIHPDGIAYRKRG